MKGGGPHPHCRVLQPRHNELLSYVASLSVSAFPAFIVIHVCFRCVQLLHSIISPYFIVYRLFVSSNSFFCIFHYTSATSISEFPPYFTVHCGQFACCCIFFSGVKKTFICQFASQLCSCNVGLHCPSRECICLDFQKSCIPIFQICQRFFVTRIPFF